MKTLRTPRPWSSREHAVDVLAGALGLALELRAAERARGLHPDQDRELAALDDPAGLARARDEPEPAAARAARLGVDVGLELAHLGDRELHRLGLVAGVRALRLQLAERLVLDGLGDQHAQARLPHPLDPDVVGLLVGVGVVHRPAGEGRPAVGVVGADRLAGAEQVAGDVEAAVGPVVVLVVAERLREPVGMERLAVDDAAAGAQVGGDVHVGVGEAEDAAVGVDRRGGPAARANLGLGVAGAAPALAELEAGRRLGRAEDERAALGRDRELLAGGRAGQRRRALRAAPDRPLRRRAGHVRVDHGAPLPRRHQRPPLALDQVGAEPGRLQVEAVGIGLVGGVGAVALLPAGDDEAAVGTEGDAAVGERGLARRRRALGGRLGATRRERERDRAERRDRERHEEKSRSPNHSAANATSAIRA